MKTLRFKHTILLTSTFSLASCFMALSEANALIITEVMYNPYSEYNGDYNWIEVYNEEDTDINFLDYTIAVDRGNRGKDILRGCFDANDPECVPANRLEKMQNSSIPLTTPIIPAGGVAVIYGSVVRDAENDWGNKGLQPFSQIWNPDSMRDINFIPMFNGCFQGHNPFCALGIDLFRTGASTIGLWKTQDWNEFQNTENDVFELDLSKAVVKLNVEDSSKLIGSTFPESNNSASIYLTDLSADPNDGSNWALSVAGLDGAYAVDANTLRGRIEPGLDVASPGYVPNDPENVPEPLTILGSITALGFGGLFKRKFRKFSKKS